MDTELLVRLSINRIYLIYTSLWPESLTSACILLQLQYSPRRIVDFGLSDGEQLERLWSFLRRFSKMTKEMRPSHRIDVLSDAILHYGRQCKDNLGKLRFILLTFKFFFVIFLL